VAELDALTTLFAREKKGTRSQVVLVVHVKLPATLTSAACTHEAAAASLAAGRQMGRLHAPFFHRC